MKTETYTASLDSFTKTLTWFVIIILAGVGFRSVAELTKAAGDLNIIAVHGGVILLLVAILLGSYAFGPQGYVLGANELVIKRLALDKHIKLTDLAEVRILNEEDMSWTIRTFGVGGLFGHYGKYYNKSLGSFTQYATRRNNQIFMRTHQGKKIIITPDDLELAVKLQSAMLQPA